MTHMLGSIPDILLPGSTPLCSPTRPPPHGRCWPSNWSRAARASPRTGSPASSACRSGPPGGIFREAGIPIESLRGPYGGYRSEAGSERRGEVDPWAVVVRHGRWYCRGAPWPHGPRALHRIDLTVSTKGRGAGV